MVENISGITAVKKYYNEIQRTANDDTLSNVEREDAINKCYNVTVKFGEKLGFSMLVKIEPDVLIHGGLQVYIMPAADPAAYAGDPAADAAAPFDVLAHFLAD